MIRTFFPVQLLRTGIIRALLTLAAVLAVSKFANAQTTYYWGGGTINITPPVAPAGGVGTWNTTIQNWATNNSGTVYQAWNNSNNDTAVFAGTAGTVTLGTGITVGGLQFNTTNYALAAGTNGLTFGAANNTIYANGANSNIATTITGTVGGSGKVILSSLNGPSANTVTFNGISSGGWSGSTTINAGMTLTTTTTSGNINRVLNSTSGVTLNGGTVQFNRATNAQLNAISDSAAISVNSGGTFGATSADAGGLSAIETIGAVTVNSGQMNFNWTNGASSGATMVLSGLTRNGTSAVTFSGNLGSTGRWSVAGAGTTNPGEIIGPWATTGAANGIATQTDYAVYSSNFVASAGIAASAQSTWSTTTSATSNYTMSALASGTLSTPHNINSLRSLNNSVSVTANVADITLTGHTLAVGDVVTFSAATMPAGLTTGTPYYVVAAGSNTIQVSATAGGAAITPTTAGTTVVASGAILLSSGKNLGTTGILNGSATTLNILQSGGAGVLTLPATGAGNLYVTTGAGQIAINAPIQNFDASSPLTLVKSGTGGSNGTLTLSGTNTYTGGTVLNAGSLTFGTAGAWVSGQNLTFGGGGTVNASVGALTGGTLNVSTGANAIMLGTSIITFNSTTGGGTIIYGGGSSATFNLGDASGFTGNLISATGIGGTNPYPTIQFSSLGDTAGSYVGSGAGSSDSNQKVSLVFNSTGSTPLTFDNRQVAILSRYTGTNAPRSTILLSNSANAGSAWVINTNLLNNGDRSNQALSFDGSNAGNNEFHGAIGDSTVNGAALNVYKNGTGRWIFSGSNTFTGRLIVSQGTLSVSTFNEPGVSGSLGKGSVIQLGGDDRFINSTGVVLSGSNTGILEYTGGAVASSRAFLIGDSNATATGSGTILNNGTGAITFTASAFNTPITGITGTRTLTLDGTNTALNTVQGVIADNVASTGKINLVKSGVGTWMLSGANTYSGTTTINAGALDAVDGTGLPTNSILQLRGGVFQSHGNFTRNVSTAAGAANWSTSSGGFAARGGTLNLQLNGGTASVTWNGSSMVTTGQTLIFGSTSADSLVDWQNALNLGSSSSGLRTIQVNDNPNSSTDIARVSGQITNTAAGWGILKTGDGTLQLTNASNSYSGGTSIANGTLSFASGALGTTGSITFTGNSTLQWYGSNTQDVSSRIVMSNGVISTFDTNSNNVAFATAIGSSSSGTLIKTGAGTLTITGTNTYTGATQVNGGTLLVNGPTASGSAVTVGGASASGTPTLGGTGTISGSVTIASANGGAAGTLSAGNGSGGTLTLGNGLNLQNGSTLNIVLSNNSTVGTLGGGQSTQGTLPNPTSNNFLNITGGSTTFNSGTKFFIDGTTLTFDPVTTYSYKIAQGAGDQTSLNINSITSPSQFSFINFSNSNDFEFSITGDLGGRIYLNVAPVPEPAAVILIAAGALGLGCFIRRRRLQAIGPCHVTSSASHSSPQVSPPTFQTLCSSAPGQDISPATTAGSTGASWDS